jgi:hypothetical protein
MMAATTKTKRLSPAARSFLEWRQKEPHRWWTFPLIRAFNASDVYATPAGTEAVEVYFENRRTNNVLFDDGILELERGDYHWSDGSPATGAVRVSTKGLEALKTGRYEIEDRPKPVATETPAPRFNPYRGLSPIVRLDGISDAGEFGAAICPCCGALGRYTYAFTCADGEQYGAMRGCFGKYPKHRFLEESQRIAEKEQDIKNDARRGIKRQLASWDVEIVEAIDAFLAGRLSEQDAENRIREAKRRKADWCRRRYRK